MWLKDLIAAAVTQPGDSGMPQLMALTSPPTSPSLGDRARRPTEDHRCVLTPWDSGVRVCVCACARVAGQS